MTGATLAITVVGAGTVGTNLATRFADVGHDVTIGARDPGSQKVTAALAAFSASSCRKGGC